MRRFSRPLALSLLAALLVGIAGIAATELSRAAEPGGLKPVSDFDAIADKRQRSLALFQEAGKVILHPRCVNCHPAGDRPTQGMDMHPHQPPVFRGEDDFGMAGMKCSTCHGPRNVELAGQAEGLESIPGNPKWMLAPRVMAWQGKSLGAICEQIKDIDRNGGKDMAELIHHMAEDELVGWGWQPGKGREPAPGTQKSFGEIFKAWADSGAECPPA